MNQTPAKGPGLRLIAHSAVKEVLRKVRTRWTSWLSRPLVVPSLVRSNESIILASLHSDARLSKDASRLAHSRNTDSYAPEIPSAICRALRTQLQELLPGQARREFRLFRDAQ